MERKASAIWNGELKTGSGIISTESGTLYNEAYSFLARFDDGKGTNPEELIAAAHAGCFSMALSVQLTKAGLKAEQIETSATVTLEQLETGWTVSGIHLDVKATVPGAEPSAFEKAAEEAKINCPISRLLHTQITMNAQLEKQSVP